MNMLKHGKRYGLGLVAALYLAGCGNGSAAATETGAEAKIAVAEETKTVVETTDAAAESVAKTEEAKTEAALETTGGGTGESRTAEPDPTIDRYEEIIDRSRDEGKLVMYFLDLDVGADADDKSGDSTLLISPDGKVMLLDAGHPDCGPEIVETLKALGIEKIDYLVASHPHIDHIGGIPEVVENFEIGAAYSSYVEYTTQTYHDYVNALKEKGLEIEKLKTGDVIDFGEQVQVEILGPGEDIVYPEGFPDNSTQFLNNNSLLMKFVYGDSSALFGGDLYISQEREYVDQYGEALDVDVAKANHHGADTSNLRKWIKALSAQVVVAMGDDMGSMDAYEYYVKQGASYHHTLYDGIVKVLVDDKKNCEVVDQKDSWMN